MADLVPMSQAATTSLVTTLQNTDLFALAREDITSETGYRSKVARVDAMAKKVVNETDYSQLQTTDKKIIGAINEVNAKASQFDNMTATASGSIASFTDGGDDIPVSEYECEIVAQQASGTPTPVSPLPITGFSQADIPVSGKNLANLATRASSTVANITSEIQSDNHIIASGVSSGNGDIVCYFVDNTYLNGTFTLSLNGTDTRTGTLSIFLHRVSGSYMSPISMAPNNHSINVTLNDTFDYILLRTSNTQSITLDCKLQIELGNTATAYEPYTGNLYTVAFGQTIYGGRLIYKNGQWAIEATWGVVDLGSLTWLYANGTFYINSTPFPSNYQSYYCRNKCSIYKDVYVATSAEMNDFECRIYSGRLYVKDSRYTDAPTYQTNISGTKLIYVLETPTIIPITSTTRVKTISGVNNIFSNTGDNSVKYFTENADSLAELIKAFVL